MYRCLPSDFLFLFGGSLEEIICCDILLFVFCALCEEFSCSWILFFNADFICALIKELKIFYNLTGCCFIDFLYKIQKKILDNRCRVNIFP